MFAYGWPHSLVISSGFILNYIDRFMLANLLQDTASVAYYDAAYMIIGSILGLMIRPFNLFLFPAYSKKFITEGGPKTIVFIEKLQRTFLFALLIAACLVLITQEVIMDYIFPANFFISHSLIPFLAVGLLFNGVYISSMAGLYIEKKTKLIALASLFGIIINVLLNYILIPTYGAEGAAIGTSLGFVSCLIIGSYFAKRSLAVKAPFYQLFLSVFVIFLLLFVTS